jgi:aminopeptidase N
MRGHAGGPDRDVLGRDEARERSRLVRHVSYALSIDLAAGGETYTGRTVIELERASADRQLMLDFSGHVTSARRDGRPIELERRGHRLLLPPGGRSGRERLEIDFRSSFDRTGNGLHRFVDPEDGEVYIYSNLGPFAAHRVFPCFDQPDLKATFTLRSPRRPAGASSAPCLVGTSPSPRE